jgi:hypothetical protein
MNTFNFLKFLMFETKENHPSVGATSPTNILTVSDEEWAQVARATRNATWGAVFYIITTDLFGPMSVP